MRRSVVLSIRFRELFGLSGKSRPSDGAAVTLPKGHAESRAREEEEIERKRKYSLEQRLVDGESPEELDPLFARGFLKSLKSYYPPKDVQRQVTEGLSDAGIDVLPEDWKSVSLEDDPVLKFKLLTLMESRLEKSVPNSRLHEMKTAEDVHRFYQEPLKNRTNFSDLARSTEKPMNLTVTEYPLKFYPEEVHLDEAEKVSNATPHKRYALLHKGVTAFPKLSGHQEEPRQKKLYREFQAKTEWHHYQDRHFDYTEHPPDAPWTKENAARMDREFKPKKFSSHFK